MSFDQFWLGRQGTFQSTGLAFPISLECSPSPPPDVLPGPRFVYQIFLFAFYPFGLLFCFRSEFLISELHIPRFNFLLFAIVTEILIPPPARLFCFLYSPAACPSPALGFYLPQQQPSHLLFGTQFLGLLISRSELSTKQMSSESFYIFMINRLKWLVPSQLAGAVCFTHIEIVAMHGEVPPLCPPLALKDRVCVLGLTPPSPESFRPAAPGTGQGPLNSGWRL